jgi:hypothetical protein
VTGISLDGGYADYMVAPATGLARVPVQFPAPDAAPLMCAGVTTFNALRNSDARPGDLVAVLGVGGLGHLGVQYAGADGVPHRRDRPGGRTRSRSPGSSARRTTSTAKPPTPPPSWRSWAAPRWSSPP